MHDNCSANYCNVSDMLFDQDNNSSYSATDCYYVGFIQKPCCNVSGMLLDQDNKLLL